MSSGSGVDYQSNDYYSSQPRGFLTPPPTWRTRRCSPVMPGSENKLKSSPQSKDCPFHIVHKVPSGDSPYVRAKHTQLIDKDPSKAISLFWAAINSGDRVDSALKDMAVVMKQLDRSDEAIEAIKSFRHLCPSESQESLDNILVELYKQSGRTEEEIEMLQVKLKLLEEGIAFGGKRTKMARSQGKKIHITIEKEYSRLLGNLAWAYMQQKDYKSAEEHYRKALSFESDKNKQCNLAVCLMHMNKLTEAKFLLQATTDNGRVDESHAKSYERAYQTLLEFESQQPSPLPLSVKKRAFTGFPNEKRADYSNWKTNQSQLKLSQQETYSQLKRANESPCNRTIPKVPFTQPQRRARIGGPTDNAYGISCRKLSFGSFVGSENINYYATAHPPSEAPKVMPNFSEKHFPFTGGDWRKNSSDNLVRNSGTVKLPLETAAEECVLPLDSASSTDCRKIKEEISDKNPGQGYRKTCEFSKYEHKSWADMVEEDELQESLCSKGFNDENMDSNIIQETPKSFDQAEKLVQKIERIDLGSGYFTQPEKTALQKNQSTVRRSLCFDQNQNSDTAKFDCTSPLATKVFNFEDNDIGTPSSEECSSNKSIKRRNRLQVFQDITLDSENP